MTSRPCNASHACVTRKNLQETDGQGCLWSPHRRSTGRTMRQSAETLLRPPGTLRPLQRKGIALEPAISKRYIGCQHLSVDNFPICANIAITIRLGLSVRRSRAPRDLEGSAGEGQSIADAFLQNQQK